MHKLLFPLLLMLSLIACCIEVEVSVPGFPSMARYFSASDMSIQLTIAFNLLGFCIASIFYGPLSECYGRRIIMLIGSFIMLVGATACVFASTIHTLYVARFIQGVGAATPAVVVFAMVADTYQGEASIKILGIFNAVFTTLIAVAPVVGGFINEIIGWRGNYALIAIITGIAWLALLLALPETNKNSKPLNAKKVTRDYHQLLCSRLFMSMSTVPSLLYAGYIAFVTCSSFLYMDSFGLSTTNYVLQLAFIIGVFAVVSLFASKIMLKIGEKKAVLGSLIFIVIGISTMISMNYFSVKAFHWVTGSMSLYCVGSAILYPILFSKSLELFPDMKGNASSMIMSMRTLLMAAITGFTSVIYNGTLLNVAIVLAIVTAIIVSLTLYILKCCNTKNHAFRIS